jgi:hypothetical protein
MRVPLMRTFVASAAIPGASAHACFEEVISHQQRESPVGEAVAGRQHRYPVFEVPLGIGAEVNRYAARGILFDSALHRGRLKSDDDFECRDSRVTGSLQCSNDQRCAHDALEKLGLTCSVVEPVAVARGQHESGPDRNQRSCCHYISRFARLKERDCSSTSSSRDLFIRRARFASSSF